LSASNIASALVVTLSSASRFGPKSVGLDYGTLETANASGVIVSWATVEADQGQFGNRVDSDREWTFLLDTFSKDTGNVKSVLARTLACVDDVLGAISDDPTLQGTVERVSAIRGRRNIDLAYEAGGFIWLRMPIEVDVVEWPYG